MLQSTNKIFSLKEKELTSQIRQLKHPIVFTNGCFDILHRGHTTYLETARNLGESLIVGVNSDTSVKRQNKGSDRPINNQADRQAMLAALACVDAVIVFNEDTPLKLIELITPDILVKGGDWQIKDIIGAEHVKANGGEVHSIAFEHDRSTTQLLEKIRLTQPVQTT